MSNNIKPTFQRGRNGKLKYHQGQYTVINIQKYIGNPTTVYFKSGWERNFCYWCDTNSKILRWSCEHIVIPYQDGEGHFHRYTPDFYIEKISDTDKDMLEKLIIEIKPKNEVKPDFVDVETGAILPPERFLKKITAKSLESYEYRLKTFQKNLYKWTKARNWCKANGFKFFLIHEDVLKQKGIIK